MPGALSDGGFMRSLRKAAIDSGCEVEVAFDQTAHVTSPWNIATRNKGKAPAVEDNRGICYGLCVTWLDLLEKGEAESFFNRVSGRNPKNDLRDLTVARHKSQVDEHADPYASWGPTTSLDYTGKGGKSYYIRREHRKFKGEGEEDTDARGRFKREQDTLDKLTEWLDATFLRRRFFLIHMECAAGKHCMAAAKNRKGRVRFYDPNGGVAGAWFSKSMVQFLRLYFTSKDVFTCYRRPNTAFEIWVSLEKYKSHLSR